MTTETKSNNGVLSSTIPDTIALNDPKPNSRGRNGYFRATAVSTRTLDTVDGPLIVLDASSRRPGHEAPLSLSLSPEDALLVADALQAAAERTIHPELREAIRVATDLA